MLPGPLRGRRSAPAWATIGAAVAAALLLGPGGAGARPPRGAVSGATASPTTPAQFLAIAEAGLERARRAFWNPHTEVVRRAAVRDTALETSRLALVCAAALRGNGRGGDRRPDGAAPRGRAGLRGRSGALLQPEPAAGRRAMPTTRAPAIRTSTPTSTTTAGGSSRSSTPTGQPATGATSATPSVPSASSPSPAGTRSAAASGGRRSTCTRPPSRSPPRSTRASRSTGATGERDVPDDRREVPRLGRDVTRGTRPSICSGATRPTARCSTTSKGP